MDLYGDKGRAVLALAIARTWKDEAYRETLLKNPKATLRKEGLEIPDSTKVKVFADTENAKYIPLTKDLLLEENEDRLLALLRRITPIPEDKEVRLVQSADDVICIVLPLAPSEDTMARLAAVGAVSLAVSRATATVEEDVVVLVEAVEVATVETTEFVQAEVTVEAVVAVVVVLI